MMAGFEGMDAACVDGCMDVPPKRVAVDWLCWQLPDIGLDLMQGALAKNVSNVQQQIVKDR
jgi:hypothetical protein